MFNEPTILIVPGLRDQVAQHWQTLLEARLRAAGQPVVSVAPMGRADLSCAQRVTAIERAAQVVEGPLVIVAHSGGVIMVAHWARQTRRSVLGALLATPPDFDRPLPDGYPTLDQLSAGGWLPFRACRCHSRASSRRAVTTRWPASIASAKWPRPGAAVWSTSARSDT